MTDIYTDNGYTDRAEYLDSDCTLICGCTTSDEREACTRACDTVVL